LAVNRELDRFLESVERRAFIKARLATGNEQEALDVVQDAMFMLVKSYGDKATEEWGPLFQRILQHRITDWYRRQNVKNRLFGWLGGSSREEDAPDRADPMDSIDRSQAEPWEHASGAQIGASLQIAIGKLPVRQQQAFLLRQWDGLSTEDTAKAMGCSQGSVKTHFSRALSSLRKVLQDLDINLKSIDGKAEEQ